MNILYILSSTAMDGSVLSALSLIEEMNRRLCKVVVVSPFMNDNFRCRLEYQGIICYTTRLGFYSYPTYSGNPFDWLFNLIKIIIKEHFSIRSLLRIIKTENIEIVHTNVGPITCGYKACIKANIPHVWHIREYGDQDFEIKMFPSKRHFRRSLLNSHVITITSDLLRYNNLEHSSKAIVLYNGVRQIADVHFLYPKGNYFLCASRISPEKGFDQIIRVFARIYEKHPSYKLIIVGSGRSEYIAELKQLAEKKNVINAIVFAGYKDDVTPFMARARALLVASLNEGFGRMTAEAAFAGCLVVGKNTAGTKEIMEITGGYPFLSDDEMLNAMENVIGLPERDYRQKALYAQDKAKVHFSKENYVNTVYELYRSILNN